MKILVIISLLGVMLVTVTPSVARAQGLNIQPYTYSIELKTKERQKGIIDVRNPSGEKISVTTSVQAFRQIDDKGTLEFYDNEQVAAGITPDLKQFELGPRQTMRMVFEVDGAKLPPGDVFGAVFFSAKPATATRGVSQAVRLGTILSIVNGVKPQRSAEIISLTSTFLHTGDAVSGSYVIKNTGNPANSTGFYPEVTLSLSPFQIEKVQSSTLVFAGRSRTNDFMLETSRFGLYKLSANYGEQTKSKWIFVATGWWRWVSVSVILVVVFGILSSVSLSKNKR